MGADDMGNDLEAEIDDLRNEVESLKAKVFINEGAFDGINTSISDISSDLSKLDEEFHLSEKDWHPFMGDVQGSGTTIEIGSGYVYAGGKAVWPWPTTEKVVSSLADGTHLMYMDISVIPGDGTFGGVYVPTLKTVLIDAPETVNNFTAQDNRSCGIIIGDFTMSGGICTGWRQRWCCDMYVPVFTFLDESPAETRITVWGRLGGTTSAVPVPDADAHYSQLTGALQIIPRNYYVATWHLAVNESTLWSDENAIMR